jgi:hypothetical protein
MTSYCLCSLGHTQRRRVHTPLPARKRHHHRHFTFARFDHERRVVNPAHMPEFSSPDLDLMSRVVHGLRTLSDTQLGEISPRPASGRTIRIFHPIIADRTRKAMPVAQRYRLAFPVEHWSLRTFVSSSLHRPGRVPKRQLPNVDRRAAFD